MSTPSREVGQVPAGGAHGVVPASAQRREVGRRARAEGLPGDRIARLSLDEARVADIAALVHGHDPAGVARQFAAIAVSPDRTSGLRELTVPTLVIHGEDDPLVEVDGGLSTANAVPGARLVVVPGMGQNLPEQLWPQFVDSIVAHTRTVEDGPAAHA